MIRAAWFAKLKVNHCGSVAFHDYSVGALLLHLSGIRIHVEYGALVEESVVLVKPFRHLGVGESIAQHAYYALLVEGVVVEQTVLFEL